MKSTGRAFAALAALVACTVAIPVIAQDNPNAQPNRRQRSRRSDRPNRAPRTPRMEPMATAAPMQPVAPDFQRNIDKANQTLDNMVKLLASIDARKSGAQ